MDVDVMLPQELDVALWREKHLAGMVPDLTPYGLHRMEHYGVVPSFVPRMTSPRLGWVAERVRNHLDRAEIVAALATRLDRSRRPGTAVLCMDERTGLAAAATARADVPVLSGLAWLSDASNLSPVYRAYVRRAAPRLAAAWTNVAASAPLFARACGIAERDVHAVPLGVDATFFPAQPWPEVTQVVASAGEDRMRDHELLLNAVRLARQRAPQVHLEIAATGFPEVDPVLATVHRQRMNGAMREVYRRSGVVAVALHPNAQGSGLTVVLEAMASGRPVVVTDNPGMSDYVEHGVTGLLVRPADSEAMADAIVRLLTDRAAAEEMGAAGRARVEKYFTSEHMAAHLASLVRTVVGGSR